jgi:hypothetical protein
MLHRRLCGLQVGLGNDRPDLVLQFLNVRLEPPNADDAFQHAAKFLRRERLGKKIERPAAHGLDRRLDRRIRGNHHHRQSRSQAQERQQQVQSLFAAKSKIEKCDVEKGVPQMLLSLSAVAGFSDLVVHRFQGEPHRLADALVVIDQQDLHERPQTAFFVPATLPCCKVPVTPLC